MKKLLFQFLCLLFTFPTVAQWKWSNPFEAEFPVIQNQGFVKEIGQSYVRLPNRAHGVVSENVWNLSRNSTGLAIHFYSNATQIQVRYTVTGGFSMPHMPATGVSGLDLYRIDSNGAWQFCFGNYSFQDTISYTYHLTAPNRQHELGFEYRLYLPLYNSVKWLEIGIPETENATFKWIPVSTENPIVLYGTSIAQGGCASRPAMAWGSIVQRSLDYPLINLGFSGNGKLAPEVLGFINEIDARLYILDCLPNLTTETEEEVMALVVAAVKQIREKHATPILLIEHDGYGHMDSNANQYDIVEQANRACFNAYEQLQTEGISELYYLSRKEMDMPANGWVDGTHPTDLGMQQQATAVEKKVREILHIPVGELTTTRPVTQRREPSVYEWRNRHADILAYNRNHTPKAILLGNSITHYWGGEPGLPKKNGSETWEKVMQPAGFQNLGCGWDRIENVLWRVYHGELDGFRAQKVVLMIGTNNIGINTDTEIIAGLHFLLTAIHNRQPQAELKVIGILPRRNEEERIRKLNVRIKEMVEMEGYTFTNPGKSLLRSDGKIDESLFLDGLHPNDSGYARIANEIVK